MKILGKLLGSEKIMSQAAEGLDKIFFTKEEKAEGWLNTLKAYEPFKIAQRLIALMVVGVFLLVFLIAIALLFMSIWFETTADLGKTIAELNVSTLGLSVAIIIGFYFAGGAAEGIINKFKNRVKPF
jgi:hypothetical protein